MSNKDFIKKNMGQKLSKVQEDIIDALDKGEDLRVVSRRVGPAGMTVKQLDIFNKVCAAGDKSIEWHAKDWVAMDRKHYENLVAAASKSKVQIIYDEGLPF